MRIMKKIILASLALVAVASLSSCGAKKSAYRKAYEQAKYVDFKDAYYRKDIGARALKALEE